MIRESIFVEILIDAMPEIRKILPSDELLWEYTRNLLEISFPVNERRDFSRQRLLASSSEIFSQGVIIENELPVGVICWWNFPTFLYIEHFVIDPMQRNKGLGEKVLKTMRELTGRSLVLEVELPVNEINNRRINFYKRNGFSLFDQDYLQPPYRRGEDFLPMKVMSTNILYPVFDEIKQTLYREVYGFTE